MDFEKELLAGCIQDEEIMRRAYLSKIRPRHFKNEISRFLYQSLTHLRKIGEVNAATLVQYIRLDESIEKESKSIYTQVAKDLAETDLTGAKFSLSVLSKKRKQIELAETLNAGVDSLFDSNIDPDEIIATLSARIGMLKSEDHSYEIHDYYDQWGKRQAERQAVEDGGISGLKMIENLRQFAEYFPRGIAKSTITAIGGPTYAGKSVFLANMVHVAAHPDNKLNVLYFIAENRVIEAGSRLDAIFMGRQYESLFTDVLRDEGGDDFFRAASKTFKYGRVKIVKVTPNAFDVDTLRSAIDECIDDGFTPDVLAIDSPDHMVPAERKGSSWQDKGQVYWELKQMCDEREVIVLATLPMKPSSTKKDSVSAEETAGSYDIARICDNMIFFNVNSSDRLVSRAKLQVVKARDGQIDSQLVEMKFLNSLRMIPWEESLHETTSIAWKIRDHEPQE